MDLSLHHQTRYIKLNGSNHVIEHGKGFRLVFHDWVVLSIAPQADRIAELVQRIDVVCPLIVHHTKNQNFLELTNPLFIAQFFNLLVIDSYCPLEEVVLDFLITLAFKICQRNRIFGYQTGFGRSARWLRGPPPA